jgi:hypothetical protein
LTQTWNVDLINQIFTVQAAHIITHTNVVPSREKDIVIWKHVPNGLCAANNVFSYLNAANQVTFSSYGTRGVPHMPCKSCKEFGSSKLALPSSKLLCGCL